MRPDTVLLDVMLPGASGFDICQDVRKDPDLRHVRIIMMTARGSAQQQSRCIEAGADDFIPKPFDLQSLRTLLRA